jgi:hypothetical protein
MTTRNIDDSSPRHAEDPNTTDEPHKSVEIQPPLEVKIETTPKIAFFTKVTYVQIFHSRCWLVSVFLVLFVVKNDEIMNMQKTTVFLLKEANAKLEKQENQAEITLQNFKEFFMATPEMLNTLKAKMASAESDKVIFNPQVDARGKYKLELVVSKDDTPIPGDYHFRKVMRSLTNPDEKGMIVVGCADFSRGLRESGFSAEIGRVFTECFIGWLKEYGRGLGDPNTHLCGKSNDDVYAVNLAEHHLPQITAEEAFEKAQQWKNELEKTERSAYEIDRGEFLAVMHALMDDSNYQQLLAELCDLVAKNVEMSCSCCGPRQYLDCSGPLKFPGGPLSPSEAWIKRFQQSA